MSVGQHVLASGFDEPPAGTEGTPVRVKVHPGLCNGWGQCWRWAPEVFQLDDEGYVDLLVVEVPAQLAETARRGAAACPEQAITIIECSPPAFSPPGA